MSLRAISWALALVVLLGPVRSDSTLEFEVDENEPAGKTVGFISGPRSRGLYLTLVSRGPAFDEDVFVDKDTGEIRTKVPLDRERRSSYSLVAIPPSGNNTLVIIKVRDVNDNAPSFPIKVMETSFSENTPRTVKRTLVPARDPDLGVFSTQTYSIVSGNVNEAFILSPHRGRDGVLYLDLQIKRILDRETTSSYALVIEAEDGGSPPLKGSMELRITIEDVNDNQPIFSQSRYSATIPENTTIGTVVHKVLATDTDFARNSDITYSINRRQSDRNGLFRVDPKSGEIIVNRPLDFETKKVHELIVVARDNGTQPLDTSAFVSITVQNVNDNLPSINLIFLSDDASPKISEDAKAGDFVARISVNDPDTKEEYDSLDDVTLSGGEGTFKLEKHDNVIYLMIVSRPLDREHQPSYNLTVTAKDRGRPPLESLRSFVLRVTDTNDNAPRFLQTLYRAELLEVADPGTEVIHMTAHDKDEGTNSQLLYSIVGQQLQEHGAWFQIDARTGLITTKTHVDCETDPEPRITVVVSDNGTPPLSSNTSVLVTIVDVNDNEPVFDQSFYNVSVNEDRLIGYCILNVSATDPDCGINSMVNYSMGHGFSTFKQFSIDNNTGDICISGRLDHELRSFYEFPVIATDRGGLSTTAMVKVQVLDVNDNRPTFYPLRYNVSLKETSRAPQQPVVLVVATDPDADLFGRVTYRIARGNEQQLFRINDRTGEIFAVRPVRKSRTMYHLTVEATDGGGLKSRKNAEVFLSVIDVTQQPPIFERSRYAYSVSEDVPVGSRVGAVRATSAQRGGAVLYNIYSGDPERLFSIDSISGLVTTARPLDHERHPLFLLNVQAMSGDPPTYGHTQVNVTVEDVNDSSPEFDTSEATLTLSESTAPGSAVYTAHAQDADAGQNGLVRYQLLESPDGVFAMQPERGTVTLQRAVDYERRQSYRLLVSAFDQGRPRLASNLTLHVQLQDANDNAPRFQRERYEASVREDLAVGSQIALLTATDADAGNNARLTYRLAEGPSQLFGVFPDSGWVYLRGALDRELKALYRVTVEVSDNGTPSHHAVAQLTVHVLDANDHRPAFSERKYRLQVSEGRPAGAVVGTLSASDRDLNADGALRFSLRATNGSFMVHPRTGVITTTAVLDREQKDLYEFTAEVSDGGAPPKRTSTPVQVRVLDDNDSDPVFVEPLEREVTVREEQLAGFELVQMQATDDDSGINATLQYSLAEDVGDEADGAFVIDSKTGIISTTRVLDHEVKSVYQLTVVARDGGTPPRQSSRLLQVKVLDLNDNSPVFTRSSVSFNILENVPIGYQVGHVVATDRDAGENGRVAYTILSGNRNDTFDINRSTGALFTTREVDYEMAAEYVLRIEAVDASATNPQNGKITVQISVADLNDNAPTFSEDPILFSVAESTAAGTNVWNFTATDKDSGSAGDVSYSISQQSPVSAFHIDQVSGALTTLGQLDYEQHAEYTLIVTATDGGHGDDPPLSSSVTSQIIIGDVNDNAPQFVRSGGRQGLTVRADERVGYPVLHVIAIDKDARDNGRVSYSIVSGDERSLFRLHADTGLLSVGKSLIHETDRQFALNISASDHGRPSLSTFVSVPVRVQTADADRPVFQRRQYSVQLAEHVPPGTDVVRVSASNRQHGSSQSSTRYYIPAGIANDTFLVDPRSGQVTTARRLDREVTAHYQLTVFARDATALSKYDVTIVDVTVLDVNDNTPVLKYGCYPLRIPENSETAVVHTVVAVDQDEGANAAIKYTITDGNVGNRFSLDADTGALTARPLDRELRATYILEVTAEDGGATVRRASCRIDVKVLDQNDNDPVFQERQYQARISEKAPLGTLVTTVHAGDIDHGANQRVTYSLNNETHWLFRIDKDTGRITTAGLLNRERRPQYTFEVRATDGSEYNARSSRARVTVLIDDVNDHAPQFSRYPYQVSVPPGSPRGQPLVNVTADDVDSDSNGRVSYSIVDSDGGQFRIDSSSGEIRTTAAYSSYRHNSLYSLKVRAQDAGSPRMSTDGLVELYFGDAASRVKLVFPNSEYRTSILENSPPGTIVTQVSAYSSDARQKRVEYSFTSGNEQSVFSVDASTGEIRLQNPARLDYEQRRSVKLIVRAQTDDSAIRHGYTTVMVELLDENDNKPHFTQDKYVSAVWEGHGKGTFVVQVSATDDDSGSNADVRYSIMDGNLDNAFVIESPTSGIIRTNIVLDREIRDSYDLTISASDRGSPALIGTCSLQIKVIDVNDNRPTFPPHAVIRVSEGAQVGAVVSTVTANDVDTNPALVYSLQSVAAPQFAIDRFTGRITLAQPLDRETRDMYVLTVTASDTAHLAETNVTIHVTDDNDHPPVFSEPYYYGTVLELSGPGVEVLRVSASDGDAGDNARVTYSLVTSGDEFAVDADTGRLLTSATVRYDPARPVRQLVVLARDDGGLSAAVAVQLRVEDINNHAPEFAKTVYRASISEDAVPGKVVLRVSADDTDESRHNRNVDYSFGRGNDDGMFQITSNLGEVILLRPLDRERLSQYVLEAVATDRGIPARNSTAQIIINVLDVNDHEPKFNRPEYTTNVSESLQVGSLVLRVLATDPDSGVNSQIVYDITSGDDQNTFQLDGESGEVRLRRRLDFDRQAEYRLIVRATDRHPQRPLSGLAAVRIRVDDENDNAPVFPQPVYYQPVQENAPPGRAVFTAFASDADRGRYGRLQYSLAGADPWFRVDADSGLVSTAVEFDMERRQSYAFTVQAADPGGRSGTAQVLVTVQGVDEFPPRFDRDPFRFSSPADAPPGYVVGRVSAKDQDQGADGLVQFHLDAPHTFFSVNKSSGEIVVRRHLGQLNAVEARRRRRELPSERLTVVASSGRAGSLSSVAAVLVQLDPTLNGLAAQTAVGGGLADWGVGLLVAILLIVMAFGAAFVFLHMRNRRIGKPSMPDQLDASFETSDVRSAAATELHYPPRYSEIHPYDTAERALPGRNTNSELSEQSHRSASSGRGSAEDADEDEEIRMINEGPLMQQKLRQLAVPDCRVLEEDNVSETSVHNTQEYLARLGIDTSRSADSLKGSQRGGGTFEDEASGGERTSSGAVDITNLLCSKLTAAGAEENNAIMDGTRAFGLDEAQPSMNGSLSSIVHSEEELTGSYNWDYLLNWGPQYQPLAHVFSEIARLKDDSGPSPYAVSAPMSRQQPPPPPLLTSAPPPPPPAARSSHGMLGLPQLPRSPIAQDAFAARAMSPSFSPALSPLDTRGSPAMGPHVHLPPGAATRHHRTHLASDHEMRI